MNIFLLAWKNMMARPLGSGLSILLALLGVGVVSLLLQSGKAIEDQLGRNINGIDMVVGAKGSPLGLILSSVYHIDAPTGNIPLVEATALARDPFVKKVIPLSMGDNHRGYRIVGSEHSYVGHYGAELAQGQLWEKDMEVVLGATVAKRTGLAMGANFHGTHGLAAEGHGHEESDYKVVGVMQPTGTVLDQLILTGLGSVWSVHEGHGQDTVKEITALLVQFRSPMGMMQLPRRINTGTSMQAALPSIELNRLTKLLGVGIDTLNAIAFVIILVSGISVFVAFYNALKDRRYEMALLRLLGMGPFKVFFLVLIEGAMIGLIGALLGLVAGHASMLLLAGQVEGNFHYQLSSAHFLPGEMLLVPAILLICVLAAMAPAWIAFRTDIAKTISNA